MESLVKLTVKTPNQGFEDIQINCELDWTVRKLKEYLQDVYPSKPSSSSQRLIYLGRLLQDHLSLKEVFGEWGARTLHIVCNDMTETMITSTASTSTTIVTPTMNSSPAANSPGMDGLRYRGFTSPEMASNPTFMGTSSSMYQQYMPAMSSYAQPQSAEFQQMQSRLVQQYQIQMQQYYQQMYQWQQTIGGNQWPTMGGNHWATTGGNQWTTNQLPPSLFPTPPNTPFSTSSETSFPQAQAQAQPASQQAQAQPQHQPQQAQAQVVEQPQAQPEVVANLANRNVRMNAGPGAAMQEEDEDDNENPRNRDWLDWLYTSLRAFMLLSIVYFYSSTSRFIMVTILAFLLYLYQNGWFTPRRVAVPLPQHPPPEAVEEERRRNIENEGEPENGERVNPGQDSDSNRVDEEHIQNEPPRPNPLRTLCTFCVSFVTSLIPNPPAIGQQ